MFRWAQRALPHLSETEREAIEAGDVWWDGELFSGNPDWAKLIAFPPATLSAEEQAFLNGPVDELCRLLDDWHINWELCDLPPQVWDFLKTRKFFALIIPKQYGGLGFSAYAHSEIIRKLSTRSSRTTGFRCLRKAARFPASGSRAPRPAPMPPRWSIPA